MRKPRWTSQWLTSRDGDTADPHFNWSSTALTFFCRNDPACFWRISRVWGRDELAQRMNAKVIFDGRNLYETAKLAKLGWTYRSIGRPILDAQP